VSNYLVCRFLRVRIEKGDERGSKKGTGAFIDARSQPYGSDHWVKRMAVTLGLESALRPRARPLHFFAPFLRAVQEWATRLTNG